ncbi:oxygen-dependent choline dehydrogenase-like [Planococcus citri]|uniref:oxygen-dependent choline dehydrogenase-like n=1 Tax=Planococcus citri TaxID=170843 RepID=UPI0031F977FB
MKLMLIFLLVNLMCISGHFLKKKSEKCSKHGSRSIGSKTTLKIDLDSDESDTSSAPTTWYEKNKDKYFDTNVCQAQGITINQYIPKSVIADLEQKFNEAKCKYLSALSSLPKNIGPIIQEYDASTLVYDIVIVGTGPGCLGALKEFARLGKKILLLDQGYMPPQKCTSLYSRPSMLNSQYVIALKASAPNCDVPKILFTPNVVGGVTSYDSNTWDKGSAKKFQKWGTISKKWTWQEVTKYYKHIEHVETSTQTTKTETQTVTNDNGVIRISNSCSETTVTKQVRTAFTEVGIHKETKTYNERLAGFSLVPAIAKENKTVLLAQEILDFIQKEDDVDLALRCRSKKIIFDKTKATGIKIISPSGEEVDIKIREELILSNGPIDSIKLLAHSGLGEKRLLESLGIPVQVDLPFLGNDFTVNPIFFGLCIKFPSGALVSESEDDFSGMEYMLGNEKIPSGLALTYYKAYLQIFDDEPDVLVNFYLFSENMSKRLENYVRGFFQFTDDVENFIIDLCQKYDLLFLAPQLLNVESRGIVTIDSADFDAPPVINTGMYSQLNDLRTMLRAIEVIQTVSETQAFKSLKGELIQIPVNSCGKCEFTEKFNKCALYYLSVPNLHPSGGTIMGKSVTTSVVNDDLIVHGTDNVRCFGASVIPFGDGSDSSASGCMIGNYGATIIAEKYKNVKTKVDVTTSKKVSF